MVLILLLQNTFSWCWYWFCYCYSTLSNIIIGIGVAKSSPEYWKPNNIRNFSIAQPWYQALFLCSFLLTFFLILSHPMKNATLTSWIFTTMIGLHTFSQGSESGANPFWWSDGLDFNLQSDWMMVSADKYFFHYITREFF